MKVSSNQEITGVRTSMPSSECDWRGIRGLLLRQHSTWHSTVVNSSKVSRCSPTTLLRWNFTSGMLRGGVRGWAGSCGGSVISQDGPVHHNWCCSSSWGNIPLEAQSAGLSWLATCLQAVGGNISRCWQLYSPQMSSVFWGCHPASREQR